MPTAVEVESLAQQVQGHDDALGVPSGTPRAPRRIPGGLARLGLLPEREVERGVLLLGALHPGAGPE